MTAPQGPAKGPRPAGRAGPIALIAGGLLLVLVSVFVFTAWVAPGFLVADDDAEHGEGALALANRVMAEFSEQDQNTLRSLACTDAERPVAAAIQQAGGVTAARVTGQAPETDGVATITGRITAGGDDIDVELVVESAAGTWCWKAIEVPGVELRPPR